MVDWQELKEKGMIITRKAHLLVLLLALIGVQDIQATRACGQPPVSLNRIVKGKDAVPGEFPWQISLQLNQRHKVKVPIIDTKTCSELYRTDMGDGLTPRIIKDDMICAGYQEGRKDACKVSILITT
ncbi:hypothetical protein JRQ81_005613 [Phrynocephalus forsythii]|uniref:Peptidase S1 domain-containing protein n=1 Tax=Phrynocephalus forsythii TaxID=171643 RepID=A0A9Q1AVU7_9SAUR|nr:hypothetical protein JRQ81_005613 [Phrynocephalus forsythii]